MNSYSLSTLHIPEGLHLVLGSVSQFRRKVLDDLHVVYSQFKAGINEKAIRDEDPRVLTMKLAEAKMEAVLAQNSFSDCIVISADQVAVKDGVIREKPQTKEECYRYLESYCNSGVELFSAVCVYNTNTGKKYVNCDVSSIKFANILKEVQDHLVEKGDVMYTCGGITVEDPELQKCITQIDAMDRIMGMPLEMIQEGVNS
ncbi:hypothetical protein WA588_001863, partial [Blastocystis sp. NMH]